MSHEAARSKLQDLEEKEAAQDEPLPKPGDILSSPPKTPRLEDALEMPRSSARLRRALEDAQAAGLGEARPKGRLRFASLSRHPGPGAGKHGRSTKSLGPGGSKISLEGNDRARLAVCRSGGIKSESAYKRQCGAVASVFS